LEEQLVTSS